MGYGAHLYGTHIRMAFGAYFACFCFSVGLALASAERGKSTLLFLECNSTVLDWTGLFCMFGRKSLSYLFLRAFALGSMALLGR